MSEANKQEQQQEPSMEEILASIRRIISDDGSEPESEAPRDAQAKASESTEGAAPEAAAPPSHAEPPADEEPLELTQAIQGDGTVIDLAAQRANQATEPPASEGPPETPPETEALAEEPEALAPTPEIEAEVEPEPAQEMQDEPLAEDLQPQEPEAEVAPVETAPSEPFPSEAPRADAAAEGEGVLELYGEDEDAGAADVAAAEPDLEPEPAEESMSERPTVEEVEAERLVSEATEAATLAALSGVSRPGSSAAQPPSLPGGERTLEQVVRDAIAEHLKTWLDANLPGLVERVVREEVRRLARRAEDL